MIATTTGSTHIHSRALNYRKDIYRKGKDITGKGKTFTEKGKTFIHKGKTFIEKGKKFIGKTSTGQTFTERLNCEWLMKQ